MFCYKDQQRHGACTETFYKDNVMAELKSLDNKDENKKKIQQILNKFEMENDHLQGEEDEEVKDVSSYFIKEIKEEYSNKSNSNNNHDALKTMEQRFADMDIAQTDASVIWDMLSPQERHEFEHLIKMENAWSLLDLPEHEPWWYHTVSKITPINNNNNNNDDDDDDLANKDIPKLPEAIPPITALLKTTTPSTNLIYHLLHLLMTYTYMIRISMGDLADDVDYTITALYHLSTSLIFSTSSSNTFCNINDVCLNIRQQIIQLENNTKKKNNGNINPITLTSSMDILLLKDVESLVNNGNDYILRAIGEIYQFLNTILNQPVLLSSSLKKWGMTKKSLSLAARKVYFFLVYGNYLLQPQQKEQLQLFVSSIQLAYQRLEMDQEQFDHQSKMAKQAIKSHQMNLSNKKKVTFV
ncbi:unnamed protein product [Cunninghamella blakesleeana]